MQRHFKEGIRFDQQTTSSEIKNKINRIRRTPIEHIRQNHHPKRIQRKIQGTRVHDCERRRTKCPTCTELKLVRRVDSVSKCVTDGYPDVFDGLGCIKRAEHTAHHIKLDENAKPVIHPPRRVPVNLRSKVKEELTRMEKLGVVERVHEPSDWVNSMVTVIKPNGKLRICIDPRDLNKAMKREHYPTKTIEEVISRMPNAQVFSVLDASSGFWQIELDSDSSKLCTFNTPFGRYRFKRLPFGICSAQDVFQDAMSSIFDDIEGVEVIVDDILT